MQSIEILWFFYNSYFYVKSILVHLEYQTLHILTFVGWKKVDFGTFQMETFHFLLNWKLRSSVMGKIPIFGVISLLWLISHKNWVAEKFLSFHTVWQKIVPLTVWKLQKFALTFCGNNLVKGVKLTFLKTALLKSWFDEIFSRWEYFFVFPHCVYLLEWVVGKT